MFTSHKLTHSTSRFNAIARENERDERMRQNDAGRHTESVQRSTEFKCAYRVTRYYFALQTLPTH